VPIALVGAVALCLPAWHVLTMLLSDSYMTLYAGRWIAEHGLPHHEALTAAAAGRPWIDQQWLAELIDYRLWSLGGYPAVALAAAAMIGSAYAVLAALMRRRGASVVLTICCALLAVVMALPSTFIRAQDFAFPLFALLMLLLLTDAEHELPQRRLLLLVPLLILWANVHGTVVLAAGLSVLYLLYRAIRLARDERRAAVKVAGLAVLVALTPLCTPYGLHIIDYYKSVMINPAVAAAAPEDRMPSLTDPASVLFFLPLAIVTAVVIRALVRKRPLSKLVLAGTAITLLATLLASRNIVWFGMLATLLLAETTGDWIPTTAPSRRFLTGAAGVAALAAVAGVFFITTRSNDQYEQLTPLASISAAARYADAHPCATILGDNAASSALLWHDPQLDGRVGFDARLETYPQASLRRWIAYQVATGDSWPRSTAGFTVLLASTTYNPALTKRLARTGAHHVLARNSTGIAVLNPHAPAACPVDRTG
jgi:hypothetical protein